MSYRQNYRAAVPYSGRISYSYPASQSGGSGTASYSGEVAVNVTINVNTNPFDGSVHTCNNTIDALTDAVVVMNAAQCAAIQETTRNVSKSLIDGFFGTIKTELSQQLQALDSAIKAGLGLIQEQGKAVSAQKNTMETDFNRIRSRYSTLFADLDNECYKRIYALDKNAFTLSEKAQKQLINEQTSNAAALSILEMQEESSSKMFLLISNLNRKVKEVLKTVHDYITQESRITALVDSFLFHEAPKEEAWAYIPAIWLESDNIDGNVKSHETFTVEYLEEKQKKQIAEKTDIFCSSDSSWHSISSEERDALHKEFTLLAEKYFEAKTGNTEQRVYKTMLSLWRNADLSSLMG
ncbi:MAG: hypothetical protein LBB61_10135 [Treponema sp.]|jgi:hypothetical protein|nr:hypothetical protein [Treponema sp.]